MDKTTLKIPQNYSAQVKNLKTSYLYSFEKRHILTFAWLHCWDKSKI